MDESKIDWREYGRIEKTEMTTDLVLTNEKSGVKATLVFHNISKRPLNVFTFNIASKFLVSIDGKEFKFNGPVASVEPSKSQYTQIPFGKTFEIRTNLSNSYDIPADAHGILSVKFNLFYGPKRTIEQQIKI